MPHENDIADAARRKKLTDTQRVVEATETMCHLVELLFRSTRCPDCRGKGKVTTERCTTCDGGGDVFHAMHTRLSGIEAHTASLTDRLAKLEAEARASLKANGAAEPEEPPDAPEPERAGARG